MNLHRCLTQPEVVIKEETNFWKTKKSVEQGYNLKAGAPQLTIPYEGKTPSPNQLKPNQNERDEFKEITDGINRLTTKNKTNKKKIVKIR